MGGFFLKINNKKSILNEKREKMSAKQNVFRITQNQDIIMTKAFWDGIQKTKFWKESFVSKLKAELFKLNEIAKAPIFPKTALAGW